MAESREEKGVGWENMEGEEDRERKDKYTRKEEKGEKNRKRGTGKSGKDGSGASKKAGKGEQNMYFFQIYEVGSWKLGEINAVKENFLGRQPLVAMPGGRQERCV